MEAVTHRYRARSELLDIVSEDEVAQGSMIHSLSDETSDSASLKWTDIRPLFSHFYAKFRDCFTHLSGVAIGESFFIR